MLAKKHRLPKEAKIKNGNAYSSRFFLLKTEKNNKELSRFGFVVSKKISKSAVVRNRIKRQIRRCVEENINTIISGIDMLFIVKKDSINRTTEEICLSLNKIFKKENLIR